MLVFAGLALVFALLGILIGSKTKINPLTIIYEKDKEGYLSLTRVVILGIVSWFMVEADKVISAAIIKIETVADIKNIIPDFPEGLVWLICIVYLINKGSPAIAKVAEIMLGKKAGSA